MSDALQVVAIVPSLNPTEDLTALIAELRDVGFSTIVVVDDGSDAVCRPIFERIEGAPGCEVLRHAVNLGKGRALKTAFNHVLLHYPDAAGVVTVDADGQHRPQDALKVATLLASSRTPGQLVLGARYFSSSREVPLRSLLGNTFTRWMFRFLTGKRVSDTQSGLRGILRGDLPAMMLLDGERYEYEMNMLVSVRSVMEQQIETVYLNQNRGSHFNPVMDSMRVAFVLLRFYFSSFSAAVIDTLMFAILFRLTHNMFLSLMAARAVVGPLFNFAVNRAFVFQDSEGWVKPLAKYYLLLAFSGTMAYFSIIYLHQAFGWNVIACKILVETPLSLFNFAVQRMFVFKPEERE